MSSSMACVPKNSGAFERQFLRKARAIARLASRGVGVGEVAVRRAVPSLCLGSRLLFENAQSRLEMVCHPWLIRVVVWHAFAPKALDVCVWHCNGWWWVSTGGLMVDNFDEAVHLVVAEIADHLWLPRVTDGRPPLWPAADIPAFEDYNEDMCAFGLACILKISSWSPPHVCVDDDD